MGKRWTKSEIQGVGCLAVVGFVVWVGHETIETIGAENLEATFRFLAILMASLFGLYFLIRLVREVMRRIWLIRVYGMRTARRIWQKTIWQEMSEEQVRHALGRPEAVDEHVMKKSKRETWKYYKTGHNRYRLRVKLEDGVVVGWSDYG
jgi:hypothetical protein